MLGLKLNHVSKRGHWNIKLAAKLILVEFITLTETLKSNILVFEIILSKI